MREKTRQYFPIASIRKIKREKNQIIIKPFGDILKTIKTPFEVLIIDNSNNIKQNYNTILEINQKNSFLLNNKIRVLEIFFQKKYYTLFYEVYDYFDISLNSIIYLENLYIENSNEFFFYHLKDAKVYNENNLLIGQIIDYLESSAHGILIIQLENYKFSKKEIFVPFVDKYCKIEHTNNTKKIEKVIVYNWEYFLET